MYPGITNLVQFSSSLLSNDEVSQERPWVPGDIHKIMHLSAELEAAPLPHAEITRDLSSSTSYPSPHHIPRSTSSEKGGSPVVQWCLSHRMTEARLLLFFNRVSKGRRAKIEASSNMAFELVPNAPNGEISQLIQFFHFIVPFIL
ncbi:hypothetical protein SBOR_9190 [Sclerotinia borealis F-4128]|uniref:Uncharacterized protein n=1 Tax=Sclerotinia borealis (strain F-4128) TaxID=1432307 RepID=W9C794_SCLBF|nr:hypothetical protein SBOR_9190 [Sclerotinia borealis F-4128]